LTHPVFRQKALDQLNSPDELNELLTVTSPKSWLSLGVIGTLLLAVLLWSFLATIETSVSGSGIIIGADTDENEFEAVLYVSIADGKRIRPGMTAKISPSTVRREEFGMLKATVSSVDQLPSTQSEMLAVLQNDALVQSLSSSGSIIEVRLNLVKDPTTPSGYQWTSAQGPPAIIWAGTLCEGSVVTNQQHPIELMFVR
jgi:hypothetical protein